MRNAVYLLAIAALCSGPAMAQQRTSDADAMRKVENLLAPYSQVFKQGDAAKLSHFYAEDAVYVGTRGKMVHGRQQIEQAYADLFRRIGPIRSFVDKAEEAHAMPDGSIWAIGHATVTTEKTTTNVHWAVVDVMGQGELKVRMLSVGADLSASQGQTAQTPSTSRTTSGSTMPSTRSPAEAGMPTAGGGAGAGTGSR